MKTTTHLRHFFLFAGSALLSVLPAFAVTWDGSDDGLWSTAGNWDVAPANGNSLTFTGPGNKTNTNNAGITSINLLTLSNSGWDIDLGGSAVTITNVTVTGSSDLTGNVIMTNGSPRTFTLNDSNTTLTLDGVLTLARPNAAMTLSVNGAGNSLELGGLSLTGGNANRTINGSGNVTVNGPVTDTLNTGSLIMAGAGTLTFTGASTYNVPTVINAGTLVLSGTASIANTPSITLGSDGTFDVSTLTTALVMEDGQALRSSATGNEATGGTVTTASTKDLTLSSGGLTFTAYGGVNGASATDAPLTVTGLTAGELKLNGAPITVTTTTALAAGDYVLVAKSASALVTGTPSTLTVDGEGTVGTSSLSVTDGQLILTVDSGGDPYAAWAGVGVLFNADANDDGVSNGSAFLLGADDPDVNALGLLPTTSETGGNLVMSFTCLAAADRGTATLNLEWDGDLAAPWLSVPVPGAIGTPVENNGTGSVGFIATDGGTSTNGDALIDIVATISDATESTGGKLFGRLVGSKP